MIEKLLASLLKSYVQSIQSILKRNGGHVEFIVEISSENARYRFIHHKQDGQIEVLSEGAFEDLIKQDRNGTAK